MQRQTWHKASLFLSTNQESAILLGIEDTAMNVCEELPASVDQIYFLKIIN